MAPARPAPALNRPGNLTRGISPWLASVMYRSAWLARLTFGALTPKLARAVLGAFIVVACSGKHEADPLCYPSNRPGVNCEPYPVLTQDDLPDCKSALRSDNISCAARLFAPLAGIPWPFDADRVGRAWVALHGGCATYVAEDWQLTAEHVLGGTCTWPTEYKYATDGVPFDGNTGCGMFLMMGGHPRTTTCQQDRLWDCWESVPLEGVFDTCVVQAQSASSSYCLWLPRRQKWAMKCSSWVGQGSIGRAKSWCASISYRSYPTAGSCRWMAEPSLCRLLHSVAILAALF